MADDQNDTTDLGTNPDPLVRLELRIANGEFLASSADFLLATKARAELDLLYIVRDIAQAIGVKLGTGAGGAPVDLTAVNATIAAVDTRVAVLENGAAAVDKRLTDVEGAVTLDFSKAQADTADTANTNATSANSGSTSGTTS